MIYAASPPRIPSSKAIRPWLFRNAISIPHVTITRNEGHTERRAEPVTDSHPRIDRRNSYERSRKSLGLTRIGF